MQESKSSTNLNSENHPDLFLDVNKIYEEYNSGKEDEIKANKKPSTAATQQANFFLSLYKQHKLTADQKHQRNK
jgi:hypothetical protein